MSVHQEFPLVSVITPAYNAARFIGRTIDSVLAQTLTNWEMVIVNDNSPDNLCEIVETYMVDDSRIRLLQRPASGGPAKARNAGIAAARGRYIAFLDSDDLWLPEKLSKQIEFMQTDNVAFSFTAYKHIDRHDQIVRDAMPVPERVDYETLLLTCVIGCLTAVYDTHRIGKHYMPDLYNKEDFGLWLKILKMGHVAYGLNEPLALYRVNPHSISRKKLVSCRYQWQVYREIERLPILKSLYCFGSYAFHGAMNWWW